LRYYIISTGDGTTTTGTNIISVKDTGVTPAKLSFGTWQKVSETTVGSNSQTVSLTSLDLDTAKAYLLILDIKNVSGAAATYSLFYNTDSTATNYYNDMSNDASPITKTRANTGLAFASGNNNLCTFVQIEILRDVDGYPVAIIRSNQDGDSTATTVRVGAHSATTAANVTSIQITGSAAASIAQNSRIFLFRLSA